MDHPAEDTPAPAGVVQAYLDRIQKEVHAQIEGKHKMPDCYLNGTFWIRPRDNWFALHCNKDSLEALYYPRVFVWVPHVLMPLDFEFRCIYCEKADAKMTESGECIFSTYYDGVLSCKGWNSNPVARRVVDLDSSYYILSKRLKCRKFCKRSCSMYDDKILQQLPPHLRNQFPGSYFPLHCITFLKPLPSILNTP
jgi:hypothetical protein